MFYYKGTPYKDGDLVLISGRDGIFEIAGGVFGLERDKVNITRPVGFDPKHELPPGAGHRNFSETVHLDNVTHIPN